jgi:hypothetical protein
MALTQVQGGMLEGSSNTTTTIQSNGTTAITINSSQNVGVGTASPNTRLQATAGSSGSGVVNTLRLQNVGTTAGDGAKIVFTAGTSTDGAGIASTGVALDSADLRFYSGGNTERMRITSAGVLVVGATTQSYGEKLRVYNDSAAGNAGFFWNDTTGDRDVLIVRNERATGSTAAGMLSFLRSGGVSVGSIYSNGSGTTYATSSDYRLKENIAPMTDALAKVSALKPCTYTWKDGGLQGQGFIAHELQEVVPECVVGEKDAVNEDGSIKAQSIDTSFLVATLTAAIQEQQAIITDLKARIETLEAK